jgi:hypothetical protein
MQTVKVITTLDFSMLKGALELKLTLPPEGRNKKYYSATGWHIHPNFSIVAHKRDLYLLKQINEFLGGLGKIYVTGVNNGEGVVLEFNTMAGLRRVIDHLNRYPLITQKRADYELFKKVVEMISRKEHLAGNNGRFTTNCWY